MEKAKIQTTERARGKAQFYMLLVRRFDMVAQQLKMSEFYPTSPRHVEMWQNSILMMEKALHIVERMK